MTNHVSLSVAELKPALAGFSKIIGRRTALPVLGCLKLERNAKGEVTLEASNLEDTATYQFKDLTEGDSLTCLVPFEPLSRTVKSASAKEQIYLVAEGKKGLKLTSFAGGGQIDQPLERFDPKEFPPLPAIQSAPVKLQPGFREAFRQAIECAHNDPSRINLNGVCLDVSDRQAHYVVSTNTRALFSANSFTFDLPKSIIIPSHRFLGWSGWLETDECWLAYQPGTGREAGWVQLRNGNWTVITREIDAPYPNWRNILPVNGPRTAIQLTESAVKTLLEVLPKLPGEQELNSPVGLRVEKGKLALEAKTKETDKPSVIHIQDVAVTGKDLMAQINRHYLIRALKYGLTQITFSEPAESQIPVLVCQAKGCKLMIALLVEPPEPSTPASPASPATTETTEQTNHERTEMSRTAAATTETEPANSESAIKGVVEQIEKIKETLKSVINDFNGVLAHLKLAEKEKKTTEKEIDSIRSTLRSLQKVQL